ncbi:head-tail adaptor protein [Roseivivax isoporae]|uniref:Head-tail adaptor protein n=1 Tax=Roseivivax isoporae LMG 25204 TaxID=1449351 RepID=X7F3E5_9RHOB|nr:head-tail adaptor protein [Roseivivax isoporae]ETX26606.1 hypothetical protein RISW2_21810 [Roseivivax isoporae LMG 25204]
MKDPGALRDRVAFDRPTEAPDGFGGIEIGWTDEPASHVCSAQFIYQRGSEAVEAARLTGRGIYKVRVRNTVKSREITADWRMRDLRRGAIYNVREVDSITDRAWVYIVVESGVAV